jgi:alpha-1,3-glucan synthase
MSASTAWETHGCYKLGSAQFTNFPVDAALRGCEDPWISLDHRDPSSPVRNIIKAMYQMRENYPVLNDGIFLQELSKQTRNIYLPGSNGTATELGIWSTLRSRYDGVQDFTGQGQGNQSVWLVYQNDNTTITYNFNCSSNFSTLIAPFDSGTTVKNLFYPFEEVTLKDGPSKLGIDGSTKLNGCLDEVELSGWGYKAYVPKDAWIGPGPMITLFSPGHDARLASAVRPGMNQSVHIEVQFSAEMDCNALAASLEITSTAESNITAKLDNSTVKCSLFHGVQIPGMVGSIPSAWKFTANLTDVWDGVHSITIRNASALNSSQSTGSTDTFIFRIGQPDNPIVFPRSANYTLGLLHKDSDGALFVLHKAAGADSWRYTLDWTTYSDWMPYTGGNSTLEPMVWSGTKLQEWKGTHVILQYYNRLSGSSDYFQHGDLKLETPRRLPHLFAEGPFNQWGFDSGLRNEFAQSNDGLWRYTFMTEWPAIVQLNTWGVNPDALPDQTSVFGDADGDNILDRMPPSTLSTTIINITVAPPSSYLGVSCSPETS